MQIIETYHNTKQILKLTELRLSVIETSEQKLHKEREYLLSFQAELKEKLKAMDMELRQLKGIEYELFYQIIVQGMNITKAIDKVAFDNDKEVSTIWKNYYPKVKEKIQEFLNR